MPVNTKGKGDSAATRPVTRNRSTGSFTTPDEFQDIRNALDSRRFLEKHSLLCPPGEPVTNEAISICLHQISAMSGIPKQTVNAIRSAAFLLEEIGENTLNETVKNAFDSQITEFTSDMKLLVEDVNKKIDDHLRDAIDKISQVTAEVRPPTTSGINQQHGTQNNGQSYASILINPPPHVNPKLAAREGIKARQFIIEGARDSTAERKDTQQLKADMNKTLRELEADEGKIRSVIEQRDGSTLFEVDSDNLAKWFADVLNKIDFCTKLGDGVSFRARTYNVIAFNVPLTIDPDDPQHHVEILEANELEENAITTLRWAKPIARRSPYQRSAHLILSYSKPDTANRAISNGIVICNKRCHVERIKKEPIRCLKCQGWNHIARDCASSSDKCCNCGGEHKSAGCPRPHVKWCVSCKTSEHASWSRDCSSFLKRLEEFNERSPENSLPLFPTDDPWTWSGGAAKTTKGTDPDTNRNKPYILSNGDSSQLRNKPREANRRGDSYVPKYSGNGPGSGSTYYDPSPPLGDEGWGDELPRPSINATANSQHTIRINPPPNNNATAGPSNYNSRTNE